MSTELLIAANAMRTRVPVEIGAVDALIRVWRNRASRKFADAEREKDPMGKRLIEHGAMCYANCAEELESIFMGQEAQPS